MPLTKQYLRYIPAGNFNIIASANCNVKFVTLDGQEGRYVAVGACEHIIIWDLRLGEKAQVLPGEKATVTFICPSPNKNRLAAGYSDGTVQIYDLSTTEVVTIFAGHKAEVTTLAFDVQGHTLASGSKDTDVILWNIVEQTGRCRLSGHKGPIVQALFMSQHPVLITAGRDNFVKFWDLDIQHCFKTLTGIGSQLWTLTLMKDDRYLIAGTASQELVFWKLNYKEKDDDTKMPVVQRSTSLELVDTEEGDDTNHPLQCHKAGVLLRKSTGHVSTMCTDGSGQVVGYHGNDKQLELFYFCTDEEAQARLKKRLKKKRKKEKEGEMEVDAGENEPSESEQLGLRHEIRQLRPIKLDTKPKSLDLVLGNGGELRVAVALRNNTIQLYRAHTSKLTDEPECIRSIKSQGHHSEMRAVAFSNDNLAIVSGCGEAVKMWSRSSQACLRTIQTGYVLSTIFVPGDHYVVAGLKDGSLLIIDILVGDVVETIPAHTAELWTISAQSDQRGVVTGSSDKTVKFWQFELVVDETSDNKVKVLSLIHSRTLKVDDAVLCVKVSANGKFVAVAMMNNNVNIFFADTFKLHLSLYGHSMPVLCMDISSDSTLIATGSVDRNVKIWGMDHGNCHKNMFAHDDSVTGLQFVPRTHYLFTCGKDGRVKQWDGDRFVRVITLQGHVGEARALAVSPDGHFVVSCGADRVLRMYEKSDQPLVLQDEQEDEREQEELLATSEQTAVPGHTDLKLPSMKTVGSEKAAESILECLDVCEKYKEELAEHSAVQAGAAPPAVPLLMQAFSVSTPEDFLLETFKRIRASDLEQALILLPFSSVCEVLRMLPRVLEARGDHVELVCKVSVFLLRIHHEPIVANHALLPTLERLKKLEFEKLTELRDMVGYNVFGFKFIQRQIEAAEGVQLFKETFQERKRADKKRRQREKLKRSIVTMS